MPVWVSWVRKKPMLPSVCTHSRCNVGDDWFLLEGNPALSKSERGKQEIFSETIVRLEIEIFHNGYYIKLGARSVVIAESVKNAL